MNQKDENFTRNICNLLDQSIENLDEQTKKRLRQARFAALEQPARRFPFGVTWKFASGLAVMVILGIILLPPHHEKKGLQSGIVDIDLLTSNDSLELFKHDVEFYFWLSEVMEEADNSSTDSNPAVTPRPPTRG